MKKQRQKIVLAGCGMASAGWLEVAQARKDAEVVGLVDLNPEAARARAEAFKLTDAVLGSDLGTVLKETKADVVFDCTIPAAHVGVVLTALKHGCHVLGEKPLATSLSDARRMIAAAKAAKRTYAVIQNYRYQPAIRRLKAFLESGKIGEVHTIYADYFIGAHFGGFREAMDHVLLLDMAIHSFDMGRYLSGAAPTAVYCHDWNPQGSWYKGGASATAIFEMAGGVVFNYRGSWCAEGRNTGRNGQWRLIGTSGSVTWNGGEEFRAEAVKKSGGFFSEMKAVEVPERKFPKKSGGHASLIAEFLECVRTRATPETAAADNIKSLAMVLGAVQSATQRKRVSISF
ncbi:Gfo/Idh/MocA family oxidoreductase [soil metagenome]